MELEDLQLQAVIAGETVRLNGGWKSGKSGQGNLNGNVAWGRRWWWTWRSRARSCRSPSSPTPSWKWRRT
jgi:autotransporter translocation and assembly factor TamB